MASFTANTCGGPEAEAHCRLSAVTCSDPQARRCRRVATLDGHDQQAQDVQRGACPALRSSCLIRGCKLQWRLLVQHCSLPRRTIVAAHTRCLSFALCWNRLARLPLLHRPDKLEVCARQNAAELLVALVARFSRAGGQDSRREEPPREIAERAAPASFSPRSPARHGGAISRSRRNQTRRRASSAGIPLPLGVPLPGHSAPLPRKARCDASPRREPCARAGAARRQRGGQCGDGPRAAVGVGVGVGVLPGAGSPAPLPWQRSPGRRRGAARARGAGARIAVAAPGRPPGGTTVADLGHLGPGGDRTRQRCTQIAPTCGTRARGGRAGRQAGGCTGMPAYDAADAQAGRAEAQAAACGGREAGRVRAALRRPSPRALYAAARRLTRPPPLWTCVRLAPAAAPLAVGRNPRQHGGGGGRRRRARGDGGRRRKAAKRFSSFSGAATPAAGARASSTAA